MREQTIEKIIDFFKNNESIFNQCIEELDDYNGWLNDDRYYPMDYLNEFYQNSDPINLLFRAFYGHDEDTWYTDSSGNKIYGAFNPNREYFTYNGYGNLISTDYMDYSCYLDRYVVLAILEHRPYIDSVDSVPELSILFDELGED